MEQILVLRSSVVATVATQHYLTSEIHTLAVITFITMLCSNIGIALVSYFYTSQIWIMLQWFSIEGSMMKEKESKVKK